MTMEMHYSPLLVVLSVFVAIFASYVALNLGHSVTQSKGKAHALWLTCGALAMGTGIWSMHFVGMLAFEMPGMEMAYDVPLMILSVVVAIGASALALFVVSRPVVHLNSLVAAGVAMAAGISGMHYIGMFSMRMSARIEWNYYLVVLSVIIALVASFAALMILIRLRNKPDRLFLMTLASTLMGAAISGMHYTGMFAATFVHDDSLEITADNLLVTQGLSLAVISTTLLILGIALIGSVGERIFLLRQKRNELVLGKSEEKFRVLVAAVRDYAIYMLDPQGIVTTWNSGAQRITGYSEAEAIGKHVSIFYSKSESAVDTVALELRIAAERGHFEGEAVRVRRDGSQFWANIVIDPLYDRDGHLTGYSTVTRDITDIKAANEELERRVQQRTVALQESELQLRTITNALPILVAQMDKNERVQFANNSFCDWFGLTPEKIRNVSFREILGPERYPANKPYIDRVLGGEIVTYERDSRGVTRHAILSITFVPEFDTSNKVTGFVVVATNVSNYKAIEAELKNAKVAADAASETKSAFLANMSHEIRTPLGAVIGFSELLVTDDLTPSEKLNYIEIIKRNGTLLSTIINDILDLSKVEAGKLEVEKVDVPLLDLVNEIITLLNLEATGKGIKLVVATEGIVPGTIKTDPTRLRQILFNITGNAIKFTEKGSVSLKIKLAKKDSSKLEFIIKDTGPGIRPDQASRLFSPFTQADVTTTRRFGGTGLGLVLSRKLAHALGGDVVLRESFPDAGSTFVVSISHGQSEEALRATTDPSHDSSRVSAITPPPEQQLSHVKVLVVDDSIDNLSLVRTILTRGGATVETANNGREGVDKAMRGNFNIVLMDLQMPEMDGYQATKELRTRGYVKPIIAFTAHAMKEERKHCLENGFDDHLTKPVDRQLLISTVSTYSV